MKRHDERRILSFEELLNEQGYIVYTNVGISMMPLLRQRKDLIEIRKKDRNIKKYDVALYKRDGKYILHRCIKVTPDGYIFAGDHNTFKEYDVTDDMVIGLMSRVIRDGKNIDPSSILYRLYSFLWTNFFPVKVYIFKLRRFFQRLSRITPSKLKNYVNWKLLEAIDTYNDYRITGRNLTKSDKSSTNTHSDYHPAHYLTINRILSEVNLSSLDRIIVVGCGKGRVVASLLQKYCLYKIYGIEENVALFRVCSEWTKKYSNVHVACNSIFTVDYNEFSVLYLDRSFTRQESYEYIEYLEQQMQHSITVIFPFDQSSRDIFEKRPGWVLQRREEFLKVCGLQVVNSTKRFSIWMYTPKCTQFEGY